MLIRASVGSTPPLAGLRDVSPHSVAVTAIRPTAATPASTLRRRATARLVRVRITENGSASVSADHGRIVVPAFSASAGSIRPNAGDTGTIAAMPAASASVRATSAVAGRSSGRLARQRCTSAATGSGRPGTAGIGSGSRYMWARSISVVVLACHGRRPVSIR